MPCEIVDADVREGGLPPAPTAPDESPAFPNGNRILTVPRTHPDAGLRDLISRSVELIEAEQAASGAYPACSKFSVYGFAWLRDGSFIANGLSSHGMLDGPTAFHEWVGDVITNRAERIEHVVAALSAGADIDPADLLPTRYTLDGQEGPPGWWDFQLDGYGTWLWALKRHLDRHHDGGARLRRAVELTVRYLAAAWRLPCYDWWEEHQEQLHVSTLTAIEAGLRAALRTGLLSDASAVTAAAEADAIAAVVATEGSVNGRLRKWLGSTAVDASLLAAAAPFAVISKDAATATVAAIEADLLDDGGVHRYRADVFYGGGRWPVLAGLLGEAYLRLGRRHDALAQLRWIAATADADGQLPEQVSDRLLAPEHFEPWVRRWGTVARPLLWSHAGYLSLAAQLGITA